jgi:hypothetical protein
MESETVLNLTAARGEELANLWLKLLTELHKYLAAF